MLPQTITEHFIDSLFQHPKFTQNFHKILNDHESHIAKSNQTSSSQNINEYQHQCNANSLKEELSGRDEEYLCNFQNDGEIVFGYQDAQQQKQVNVLPELVDEITSLLESDFQRRMNIRIEECVKMHYIELLQRFQQLQKQKPISQFLHNLHTEHEKPQYITLQQYKNCQFELFQKIDVCIHRNYSKIESIFSDKLNTAQIKLYQQIDELKHKCQNQFQTYKTKSKLQSEGSDLVKKLKASKSIGNLFGLK